MNKKLVACAAVAVAMIPLTAPVASADGVAAGKLAFECVAYLPAFPGGGSGGSCGTNTLGTGPAVASSAEGVVSGTIGTTPFVLAAAGANNFTIVVTSYDEPCIAGEAPVAGTATGVATITGMTGVVGSTPVSGATLEVAFDWIRGGTEIVIVVRSVTVTTSAGGVSEDGAGAGKATFAPVPDVNNLCPGGGPLKGFVTGSVAFGAASGT